MPEARAPAFLEKLRTALFGSGVYAWALKHSKVSFPASVNPVFEGDAKRGQSIPLSQLLEAIRSAQSPGSQPHPSVDRFLWLADLQASGLQTSARVARDIMHEWLAHHQRWDHQSWQLDILAARLSVWITAFSFLRNGAETRFVSALSATLCQQANHLANAIRLRAPVMQGFGIEKALIYCAVALPSHAARLPRHLELLRLSIDAEVLADGGHVSRNPDVHLSALDHLIEIRAALVGQSNGTPVWLQAAIDKMTPMLRTFVLGDGQLAHFNGAGLADANHIRTTLKASEATGRAVTNSPHSGFQRMSAGRTVVIMDAGITSKTAPPAVGNAGTLSFELSIAKQRLVVNCGMPCDGNQALATALRGTPAHSTLTLGEMNSSALTPDGQLGSRRAWQMQSVRREVDKNSLIEATHQGYAAPYGLSHKRALFLSADGQELRGEDQISGSGNETGVIRFHLHPSVQASLTEAGDSILLKYGKSVGWRFHTSNSELILEPSLYYEQETRRQTQQIVLAFRHTAADTVIKWRFAMEK